MKKTRIIILISIISGMLACSDSEDSNPIEISSIALNKTSITLHEGDEIVLSPTIYPENASDKTVVWKSTDSQVATVTDGKVKALQKGTTVITAWAGNKTATCDVTVVADVVVDKITLDKTTLSLAIEEEATLIATISPKEASEKIVVWTSDKPEVASVDDKGRIKGLKKGSALITAAAGGKSARCTVTVTDSQADNISLDETSLELNTTDRKRLVATVSPAGSATASWTTSNKEVAVVSSDGIVKATGAGTATITATAGKVSAACEVKVNPAVFAAGNSFSSDEIRLWINGKAYNFTDKLSADIKSMYIYDGDIYLAGSSKTYSYNAKDYRAYVFKVTTPVIGEKPLPDEEEQYVMETLGKYSRGRDIFVSDDGVYVCGEDYILRENSTNVYYSRVALWKDGKLKYLSNNTSGERYLANSVFGVKSDIYVAGQHDRKAAIWKNGVLQELECEGSAQISFYAQSEAREVFISNNDVYVAGHARFPSTGLSSIPDMKPVLWKNGTAQIMKNDYGGFLNSVFVAGDNVYCIGGEYLWTNNVREIIDDASLYSIFVHNKDVYFSGEHGLWKNGIRQDLEGTSAGVYAVSVK